MEKLRPRGGSLKASRFRTRGELVFHQPVQGFFASLECGQIAPGKTLDVLVEDMWEAFGANPCGALQVRAVKDRALFQTVDGDAVKLGASEVGEQQHRAARLARDIGG